MQRLVFAVVLHRGEEILAGLRPRVGPGFHHTPYHIAVCTEVGEIDLVPFQRAVQVVSVVVLRIDAAVGRYARRVAVDDGIVGEEVAQLFRGLKESGEVDAFLRAPQGSDHEDVAGPVRDVHREVRDRPAGNDPVIVREGAPVEGLVLRDGHPPTAVGAACGIEDPGYRPEGRARDDGEVVTLKGHEGGIGLQGVEGVDGRDAKPPVLRRIIGRHCDVGICGGCRRDQEGDDHTQQQEVSYTILHGWPIGNLYHKLFHRDEWPGSVWQVLSRSTSATGIPCLEMRPRLSRMIPAGCGV